MDKPTYPTSPAFSAWQAYYQPETAAEALRLLAAHNGAARVIAGGTDLLLEIQQGRRPEIQALVDVTGIAGMTAITHRADYLEVGAAVTHAQIVQSALLQERAACLVESCGVIGGPQVRHVATLGGNVAHALPAADGTTALIALAAEAELAELARTTWQPVLSLFAGPGQPTFDPCRALLTRFRFTVAPLSGAAFSRVMRPQGVALPILACAVWVQLSQPDPHSPIAAARICLGPVAPTPQRAAQAEAALVGRRLPDALEACIAAAQSELRPRPSKHRATVAYRQQMIAVLLRRTLPLAAHRAAAAELLPISHSLIHPFTH